LASENFFAGKLSKDEYEAIFIMKQKTIVVYNDKFYYRMQSLKLNNYNIDQVYYNNMIERLAKIHNQLFENGCLFHKDIKLDDQVEFLRSIPTI
jgi:hypothetical protein